METPKIIRIECKAADLISIDELVPFQGELKSLADIDYHRLRKSIEELGFSFAEAAWRSPQNGLAYVLDGHQRITTLLRMREEGWRIPLLPVSWTLAKDANEAKRKLLAAASQYGRVSDAGLFKFTQGTDIKISELKDKFRFPEISFPKFEFQFGPQGPGMDVKKAGKLADRFLVPPFSVLDARQGYWQERKREWLALGIESEVGRGKNLLKFSEVAQLDKRAVPGGSTTGTSIFDPVLCELAYRWFSPNGGVVIDPFAGGSVRGIVASILERHYFGCDLSQTQIDANRQQSLAICESHPPTWAVGDSMEIEKLLPDVRADLLFTCPPYADLERYSDDPKDLSTMPYEQFKLVYKSILARSVGLLKQDRFAAVVVGEVRDPKSGFYRDFVGDTVDAFREAGLQFYNEAILVTAVGTLALRAGRIFAASRKLGKTHQQLLIFVKGDPLKAVEACGEVELGELPEGVE